MVRLHPSSLIRTTALLLLSAGLVACGRSGNQPIEPSRPAPTKEATATAHPLERKSAPKPVSATYPPARPNLDAPAPSASDPKPSVGSVVNQAIDFVIDVTLPAAGEAQTRQAGLAEARRVGDEYRNLSPEKLKHALSMNSAHADAIQTLLASRSQSEVIRQLTRYLTDPNPHRASSSASLLISEIFADADYAPSKLAEMSFDLGEIAKRGLYDEAIASRVALLQSNLDRQAVRDRIKDYGKVGLFIVGSAVGGGFIAGKQFRTLDRATNTVREMSLKDLSKLPSLEALFKTGTRTAGRLEGIGQWIAARAPGKSIEKVRAELKVLEYTDTEINRMGLAKPSAKDIIYLAGEDQPRYAARLTWESTNRDRLQFALSDYWNGKLVNEQTLFFRIRRTFGPDQIVVGKQYATAEAAAIRERLQKKSEVEYLNIVNGDSGVEQSTIRADTREEFKAASAAKPKAERLGPTPATPTYAPAAPVDTVEAKPFDWVRAAVAATSIGALNSGIAVVAYTHGGRTAQDADNLYLERQVDRQARPPETVVSDLDAK